MTTDRDLLADAYAADDRQDVEALLGMLAEDVDRPDGDARLVGEHAPPPGQAPTPTRHERGLPGCSSAPIDVPGST